MPKNQEPSPQADERFCSAMKDLIASRFAALWRAVPAAIDGTDIEGVHDVRVASRRLRAAMDVAVDCFPVEWYRPLHKAAKQITSALGNVRDRDVIIEALQAERDAAPPEEWPGIDRLMARIERERDSARAEMLAFLSGLDERGTARDAAKRFGPAAGFQANMQGERS
jgi:CHAD domain-containing protein